MTETRPQLHRVSNLGRGINKLLFYALLLMITLAPVPYGSNRQWSWSLCALIISVLALAWLVNAIWNRGRVALSLPMFSVALFLLPVLWAAIQAAAFTPDAWSHPLWLMTSEALGTPLPSTISLAPNDSITALMRLISYGLVFMLVFQFCRNRQRAHTMLKWLAVAGVLYALYGLAVYWGNINVFFWIDREISLTQVTSSFINRNNYATYAGLGLICLIALSLENIFRQHGPRRARPHSRQQQIENFILLSWKPLLGLLLITTALVSTHSRGGFISSAIGVSTLLLVYAIRYKLATRTLLASLAGVCTMILLAYSISSTTLLKRMDRLEPANSDRLTAFKLTIDAIEDNPWAGFGYGSFDGGFKLYRNEDVQDGYDKTHNTYLENSFELGIPAAVSLFLSIAGLALLSLRGVVRRHRDWIYPATGLAATGLVASHALIDFSLQIPAVAITYSAIMGLAVAQAFSTTHHHHH